MQTPLRPLLPTRSSLHPCFLLGSTRYQVNLLPPTSPRQQLFDQSRSTPGASIHWSVCVREARLYPLAFRRPRCSLGSTSFRPTSSASLYGVCSLWRARCRPLSRTLKA